MESKTEKYISPKDFVNLGVFFRECFREANPIELSIKSFPDRTLTFKFMRTTKCLTSISSIDIQNKVFYNL